MKNQGRFQVHGNKSVVLDSADWIEDDPLPAHKGHQLLGGLEARVEKSHRKDHEILEKTEAFVKTHDFIDRVAKNNGCGPCNGLGRSLPVRINAEWIQRLIVGGHSYNNEEQGHD